MRLARYGLCVGVFLLGWLSGSFFVVTILSHSSPIFRGNSNSEPFNILSHLNASWLTPTSKSIATSTLTTPLYLHALPPPLPNTSHGILYLDFPVDDRLFSNVNYLALEVTLASFSVFRVLLASPVTSYTSKMPSTLSIHHFSKYRKRGVDIEVLPVGSMEQSRGPGYGSAYWNDWKEKCCVCNGNCKASYQSQPYHVHMYIRLCKLWRRGGVFSDFSFAFLLPLQAPVVTQGFILYSTCDERDIIPEWASDPSQASTCFTSTLLAFNLERSQAIECVLKRYDLEPFRDCIENDNAFAECFAELNIINDLQSSNNSVVEMFPQFSPAELIDYYSSSSWQLRSNVRVLWLGHSAWEGTWKTFPEGSLWRALRMRSKVHSNKMCDVSCHHYVYALPDMQQPHEVLSRASYHTGIESLSCAPAYAIIGFIGAGGNHIHNILTQHYQVLPSLVGEASMSTTSCYHSRDMTYVTVLVHGNIYSLSPARPWCYPFVEAGEGFAIVDHDFNYIADYATPYLLKRDNPDVKGIVAIRNPIERLQFQFSKINLAPHININDVLEQGMLREGKFGVLRDMFMNGSSIVDIISHYYSPYHSTTTTVTPTTPMVDKLIDSLFMQSLFLPAILHYGKVIGSTNMMIINNDEFNVNHAVRVQSIANKLFAFLGLCSQEIHVKETNPPPTDLPENSKMLPRTIRRLSMFLYPFNNELSRVIGINLTHWNNATLYMMRHPEYVSQLDTTNTTKYVEDWLDEHDEHSTSVSIEKRISAYAGHLLRAFIPEKSTDEDAGFNTTLGMLAMF